MLMTIVRMSNPIIIVGTTQLLSFSAKLGYWAFLNIILMFQLQLDSADKLGELVVKESINCSAYKSQEPIY